jgi:hypothetical protein
VFYWDVTGTIMYATVQSTSCMGDVSALLREYSALSLIVITGSTGCECEGGWGRHCITSVRDCVFSLVHLLTIGNSASSVSKVT